MVESLSARLLCVAANDDDNCDKEKYKTCLGCTVSELNCEWCNGNCQLAGTCNSAQVCSQSISQSEHLLGAT